MDYLPVKNHTVSSPTGGRLINIIGIRTVLIPVIINNKVSEFTLIDICYILNIEFNLLLIT